MKEKQEELDEQISEHLTKKELYDLCLRCLNDIRADKETARRVNFVMNFGVDAFLASLYEEGLRK